MSDNDRGLPTVSDLIRRMPVVMMTTADADGSLRSRPMLALQREGDAGIWFLTSERSDKIPQIADGGRVNLALTGAGGEFASLSGRAAVSRDADVVRELWNPSYRAWFPEGPDEGGVVAVRVTVERADYWDAPTSRVVRLVDALKAFVSGAPHETPKQALPVDPPD